MMAITKMLFGSAWVAGAAYLFGWRHWDGVGCFFLWLPGVAAFAVGVLTD